MSDIDISEPLSDMLAPLNNEQKEFLMNNYTIQTYKKNETIYCEGETPHHLMFPIPSANIGLFLIKKAQSAPKVAAYTSNCSSDTPS